MLDSLRRLLVIAVAAAALPITALPAPSRTVEERIAELETLWNEAHLHGDVDALDGLWASDLSVVVPQMRPFTKPELLKMWRSMKIVFTTYSTSDVRTRIHGDTAVVTGRLRRSRDFGGRVATEDWLFTKTYARIDGDWKVVAYHASAAPEP